MMSRIGKLPVLLPEGVDVKISGLLIEIKGPKGFLSKEFVAPVVLERNDCALLVKPLNNTSHARAMWGTVRSIINWMVKGVVSNFEEELYLNGVGYRAFIQAEYLNLNLAKSHNTKIKIPDGINVVVPAQDKIIVSSCDKERLGQFVAMIRNQRKPEPYKGKGIIRQGEHVQRKDGKKG